MSQLRRIVLVGMMGSGKSTVGQALADRLGWPLLDNDALIREATGRDGPALFAEGGEDALHAAEREAFVAAVHGPAPAVVTVAGSVVDDPLLQAGISEAGRTVWLRARAATLNDRIASGAGRRSDAVDADWLRKLTDERASRYEQVADQIVDVDDRPIDAIVDEILSAR